MERRGTDEEVREVEGNHIPHEEPDTHTECSESAPSVAWTWNLQLSSGVSHSFGLPVKLETGKLQSSEGICPDNKLCATLNEDNLVHTPICPRIWPVSWLCCRLRIFMYTIFVMSTWISPKKPLCDRSRDVRAGRSRAMSEAIGPEKLLLDRSRPVMLWQFSRPRGNWPVRPKLLRRNERTLLSSGCQHSTPTKLHTELPCIVVTKVPWGFQYAVGINNWLLQSHQALHIKFRTKTRWWAHEQLLKSSNQSRNLISPSIPGSQAQCHNLCKNTQTKHLQRKNIFPAEAQAHGDSTYVKKKKSEHGYSVLLVKYYLLEIQLR